MSRQKKAIAAFLKLFLGKVYSTMVATYQRFNSVECTFNSLKTGNSISWTGFVGRQLAEFYMFVGNYKTLALRVSAYRRFYMYNHDKESTCQRSQSGQLSSWSRGPSDFSDRAHCIRKLLQIFQATSFFSDKFHLKGDRTVPFEFLQTFQVRSPCPASAFKVLERVFHPKALMGNWQAARAATK